eukprot:scaffold18912_cov21-Tisochrysis_lutea.AAC.2
MKRAADMIMHCSLSTLRGHLLGNHVSGLLNGGDLLSTCVRAQQKGTTESHSMVQGCKGTTVYANGGFALENSRPLQKSGS